MPDLSSAGYGGLSGLVVAFLAALGVRDAQKKMVERIELLESKVVYTDTCIKCEKGTDRQLETLLGEIKALRADVRIVASNVSNRRTDTQLKPMEEI